MTTSPWLRGLAAIIMGLIVAFVVTFGIEWINTLMYPLPPGTDLRNPAAMKAAMAALPAAALVIVLAGWFVSALAAAWIATRIAQGSAVPAVVLGALLLAAAFGNLMLFPHPVWFWVVALLLYPTAIWLGARAGGAIVNRPG
jgi:hypothetical protein